MKRGIQAVIAVFVACFGLAMPGGSASAAPICHAHSVAPSRVTVDRTQVAIPVGISTDCVNFGIIVAYNFNANGANTVVFNDHAKSGTTIAGGYPFLSNGAASPGIYTSRLVEGDINGAHAEISFTPTTTILKYAVEAYIASSRSGTIVSINGLLKRYSINGEYRGHATFGVVPASGATVYLQRYSNGAWHTILQRSADPYGRLAVRFVQRNVYQYRLYTPDLYEDWHANSASTFR